LTQEDFIIALFCRVEERLKDQTNQNQPVKDPRSLLWPSEIVTLGLLFVLKGTSQRRFYLWLASNFTHLFPRLPERTRLFRLLKAHQALADLFLAEPSLLNLSDSLGIELVHPRREGRTANQVGRKGLSNGRWIVGVKFCPLLNGRGHIVEWDAESANVHDSDFVAGDRPIGLYKEVGKLTDKGFHRSKKRGGDSPNLLLCERGQCNVRMIIETVFSNWVRVWAMKKMNERTWRGMEAKLSYACAAWNVVTDWATERFGDGKTASLATAWVPL
jgi:hypothetical protein